MEARPLVLPDDRVRLEALLRAARPRGGDWPLSEHKRRDLDGAGDFAGFVAGEGGRIVGYAHVSTGHGSGEWGLEIVTHPDATEDPWEPLLVTVIGFAGAGRTLNYWPAPDRTTAARMRGWDERRRIVRYEARLPAPVAPRDIPGIGIQVIGVADDAAILAVNNRAFSGHPEQGNWSPDHLARLRAAPWYDPEGVFGAREGDALLGFCWTKLHPDGSGEIYVIGVDPDVRGRGIGSALVAHALDHLHRVRGASLGVLYVDGANAAAQSVYRRLGFRPGVESVCYVVPGEGDLTRTAGRTEDS